jgi:hypothetical protein
MNTNTTTPASAGNDLVTLRSRFLTYRWRGRQFVNGTCVVSRADLAAAQRDPAFGQGMDFWEDTASKDSAVRASQQEIDTEQPKSATSEAEAKPAASGNGKGKKT